MYLTNRNTKAQSDSDVQKTDQLFPLVRGRLVNGHHHREAADQQHDGIQGAQRLLQMLVRPQRTPPGSATALGEAGEQAAEHQDFSGEEQPHANLDGIELLFLGGEMMLKVRIVMAVRARARLGPSTVVVMELIDVVSHLRDVSVFRPGRSRTVHACRPADLQSLQ